MQSDGFQSAYKSKIAIDLAVALGETPTQEEVLCRCPLCGDSDHDPNKKRFALNVDKGKYFCHNCSRSGGPVEIASILMTIGLNLSTLKFKAKTGVRKPIVFQLKTAPVHSLPEVTQQKVLVDLLRRRFFNKDQIMNLQFGLSGCKPSRWTNRVIIEVDGVKFGKAIDMTIVPKYLTQPNFKLVKNGYININNIDIKTYPDIILTEGLPDLLSLPEKSAIMSPGTSGLFNDLVRVTSYKFNIIEVPDSDNAGVAAFLKLINRKILEDPQAHIKFCFVYWITDQIGDDINDLLKKVKSKQETYRLLVNKSLPGPTALHKLKERFDIRHINNQWVLYKGDKDVKTGSNNQNPRSTGNSGVKKGRNGKPDKISWF